MQLDVTKSDFDGNHAIGAFAPESTGAQGGAMFAEDLIHMSITDSVFRRNRAYGINNLEHPSGGGAIFFLVCQMYKPLHYMQIQLSLVTLVFVLS